MNLRDSTGAVGQSATFTVQSSSKVLVTFHKVFVNQYSSAADTSCLNRTLSVSAGPAVSTEAGASSSSSSRYAAVSYHFRDINAVVF